MTRSGKISRQGGLSAFRARAYERLDRRDPRELIVRGKGNSPRQSLSAVGDDALIIADELELQVEPDLVSSFAGARLEIPASCVQRLIELPHRVRIVRALISRETGSKTVEFMSEVFVCGRLLYTTTTTEDATQAQGTAEATRKIQFAIDGQAATSIASSSRRPLQPNPKDKRAHE